MLCQRRTKRVWKRMITWPYLVKLKTMPLSALWIMEPLALHLSVYLLHSFLAFPFTCYPAHKHLLPMTAKLLPLQSPSALSYLFLLAATLNTFPLLLHQLPNSLLSLDSLGLSSTTPLWIGNAWRSPLDRIALKTNIASLRTQSFRKICNHLRL